MDSVERFMCQLILPIVCVGVGVLIAVVFMGDDE